MMKLKRHDVEENEKAQKEPYFYMAGGLAIGTVIGLCLGLLIGGSTHHLGSSVSLGLSFGAIIGMMLGYALAPAHNTH